MQILGSPTQIADLQIDRITGLERVETLAQRLPALEAGKPNPDLTRHGGCPGAL